MKKSIIVLAALAAMTAQADNTTLYGSVRMAYTYVDNDDDSVSHLGNEGSRFGIKGSEDLGNGMSAFYKYENRIKANLDTNKLYLGLKGGFGAVSLGKQTLPVDEIGGMDDPTNALGPDPFKAEGSSDNSLKYMTPDMGGFQAGAAIIVDGSGGKDHVDAYDVAAVYNANGFHAGLGYQDVLGVNDDEIITGAVGYGNDTFEVGAKAEYRDGDDVTIGRLGGLYNVSPDDSIYASVASEFTDVDGVDDDWGAAVGYTHKFSKRTKVWTEYSFADDSDVNTLSLGLRTDF